MRRHHRPSAGPLALLFAVVLAGTMLAPPVVDAGGSLPACRIGDHLTEWRAPRQFRVTVLDGPGTGSRVVIDVAHAW